MEQYIIPALIAAVVSVLAAFIGYHFQKKNFDRRYKTTRKAEEVILKLLSSEHHNLRSFKTLKKRVGGYDKTEDKLRKILVGLGAVRFKAKDGAELWGLVEKNEDLLLTNKERNALKEQEKNLADYDQ